MLGRFSLVLVATVLTVSSLSAQTVRERKVSWARIVPNVASDMLEFRKLPRGLARSRRWLPALTVVGATAALIRSDAHTGASFRSSQVFDGFNSVFTSRATAVGTFVAPAALYAGGVLAKNSYARRTALLAGEAVAGVEIVTSIMKDIDRRRRPAAYAPNTTMSGSWFDSEGSWLRGRGSFPSGHTIAAFAVATVISRRYPHQKWLPFVAYGLAGAVGFSRVTLGSHFPSDVLMGGAMGYSIARYAVLRQ